MSAFENDLQRAQLVESARKYVERGYGTSVRQASLAHGEGCDPARWRELAEMGWLALPLPEAGGGLGGSLFEVCLIAEELGRGLVVEPFIACAAGAALLADAPAAGRFDDYNPHHGQFSTETCAARVALDAGDATFEVTDRMGFLGADVHRGDRPPSDAVLGNRWLADHAFAFDAASISAWVRV